MFCKESMCYLIMKQRNKTIFYLSNMKKITAIMGAGFILSLGACSPPEVGYISDDIHALEDTISVPRGVFATSATPAAEGSTYPLHWEITDITDAQGRPTNALWEPYEIITW